MIRVPSRLAELPDGTFEVGPTKSAAGVRTVALPAVLVPDLADHLDRFTAPELDAPVFIGDKGGRPRRSNFRQTVRWREAIQRVVLPEHFVFHDLRHTGKHLAAAAGASTRELMHRMGHGSMRAALRYQHATSERDRQIADRLSELVEGAAVAGLSHADRTAGPSSGRAEDRREATGA